MHLHPSVLLLALLASVPSLSQAASDAAINAARRSGAIAGYSLSKVQRWLHEVALKKIDPATGLYLADDKWNYRDTAADCYPYLAWAAYVVDREALNGPVRSVLHAEQKLCNHLDRIPLPYDPKAKKKLVVDYDQMVFQASEYVKDGLVAIVELTGRDEWFERMKGIEEDLWKHAKYDTPYGRIPSLNIEVNGDHLQSLARLYTMTGERKFLDWAERLADYYLLPGGFVPARLRDHGCEIIGGLGLLLGVESEHNPAKARIYQPLIKQMLDQILQRGVNEDGIMYNTLEHTRETALSDGWGYNYVTNLCYDLVAGKPVYRDRIEGTLRALANPLYKDYRWEASGIDGFADSIEGAIYLLNRLPVPEGLAWVDREMAANVVYAGERLESAPLWGTHKLQSNGVRTVLIHALMHTRGLIARPWRKDLTVGATETAAGLVIVMKAGSDWSGRLEFDRPRHAEYIGFRRDWPRINTVPEWFVATASRQYRVANLRSGAEKRLTGWQLHDGLAVELKAGEETILVVR